MVEKPRSPRDQTVTRAGIGSAGTQTSLQLQLGAAAELCGLRGKTENAAGHRPAPGTAAQQLRVGRVDHMQFGAFILGTGPESWRGSQLACISVGLSAPRLTPVCSCVGLETGQQGEGRAEKALVLQGHTLLSDVSWAGIFHKTGWSHCHCAIRH